jgi:DHA2 family multidrug resistance protein
LAAASGLYTLARRIGGNIGYAAVAGLVTNRTTFHRGRLVDHVTPYDGSTVQALDSLTSRLADRGLPPGAAADSALKLIDSTVMQQATMMAYNDVFWVMGMLLILGLPFLLLLGRRDRRSSSAQSAPNPS